MPGRNEGIGVEETADRGIVITGLQIIEPGILDRRLAIPSFFAPSPAGFQIRKPAVF